MKANELMFGDWVCYATRPFRIDGISVGGFSVHSDKEGWVSIADVAPIPLTEEMLKKNGYEMEGRKEYFLMHGDPSLALKREPIIGAHGNTFVLGHFFEEDDFRWLIEITYVHELQHALRLCGIENEVLF